MKIVNQNSESTSMFSVIKGGKNTSDVLRFNEMDLLFQVTQVFQVIYGGQFKSTRSKTA